MVPRSSIPAARRLANDRTSVRLNRTGVMECSLLSRRQQYSLTNRSESVTEWLAAARAGNEWDHTPSDKPRLAHPGKSRSLYC